MKTGLLAVTIMFASVPIMAQTTQPATKPSPPTSEPATQASTQPIPAADPDKQKDIVYVGMTEDDLRAATKELEPVVGWGGISNGGRSKVYRFNMHETVGVIWKTYMYTVTVQGGKVISVKKETGPESIH